MKTTISIICILLLFAGCRKEEFSSLSIMGEWELTQKLGMFSPINFAPGNGNEILLSDRTIREKRNGQVIRLENYRIERFEEEFYPIGFYKIIINNDSSMNYISRKDSILTFVTGVREPEIYIYRHLK